MRHTALLLALLATLTSGCAATMQAGADTQYAADFFDGNALASGGLALLPVTAGQGQEAYRRPFGAALNATMDSVGRGYGINVTPWNRTMQAINDAGLTARYNDALRAYRETSIIDATLVREISERTGRRYLLFTILGDFVEGQTVRRSAISGDATAYDAMGTSAFAQVWDAQSGDVVWEGKAAARTDAAEFRYIKDDDPASFSRAVAKVLADEIMGR